MTDNVIAFPALRLDFDSGLWWYAGRTWRNPLCIRDNCPLWHWTIMVHRDLNRFGQRSKTLRRSGGNAGMMEVLENYEIEGGGAAPLTPWWRRERAKTPNQDPWWGDGPVPKEKERKRLLEAKGHIVKDGPLGRTVFRFDLM
jgi:hypothetical protein